MLAVAHAKMAFIDPRAALVTLALPQIWALIPYCILDLHWIDDENVVSKLNQSYKLAISWPGLVMVDR